MEEATARTFLSVVSVLSQCEPPRLPIHTSALTVVLSRAGDQPDTGTPPSCAKATHSASAQHSDGAEGPPSPVAVMSDSGQASAMQAAERQSQTCALLRLRPGAYHLDTTSEGFFGSFLKM